MLRRLVLSDWKSFGSGPEARNSIAFGPLTLLVGPNASGKSNVLDAVRFLQGAALGLPLQEVLSGRWEGGRNVWTGIRGGEAQAAMQGCGSFTMLLHSESPGGTALSFGVKVGVRELVQVVGEALADDLDRPLYDTHGGSLGSLSGVYGPRGVAIKAALASTGSGRSASRDYLTSHLLLGQIESGDRIRPDVEPKARAMRDLLRSIVFYDLQPALMREAAPMGAVSLGLGGENLAAVLKAMDSQGRLDILDWVSQLCAPELRDIKFEEVKTTHQVVFAFVEDSGREISSRSASDGTLRFLGIVTALLAAPPGSLLVFEEPDIGLHSARIHLLAEILEQVTSERGVQVIATTHSPVLLSHLSSSALQNVVAFDRDPMSGNTVCSRVGDLPSFATLSDSKDRDHLISTGWLERAL